jgi:hypothetical protein
MPEPEGPRRTLLERGSAVERERFAPGARKRSSSDLGQERYANGGGWRDPEGRGVERGDLGDEERGQDLWVARIMSGMPRPPSRFQPGTDYCPQACSCPVKEKHGRGWTARICRGGGSVGKRGWCATRKVVGGQRSRVGRSRPRPSGPGECSVGERTARDPQRDWVPEMEKARRPGGTNDVEVVGIAWRRRRGEVTAGTRLIVMVISTFCSGYEGERWREVAGPSQKRRRKVNDGSGRRGRCRLEVTCVSET